MNRETLVERMKDESDLCANEGADDIVKLLDEAIKEIESLRAAALREGWISVEERKPKAGEIVLALWNTSKWNGDSNESPYAVAEFNGRLFHNPGEDEDDYSDPQWWCSLPPAPIEGK